MLIRITGAIDGIAEYLVNGQKQDREFSRDDLDERVILDGDLELTDTIIKGMVKEGERYLHITLAFKEDALNQETLKNITDDFKMFSMTAFDADEYNFYAEAHLPKIKSYTNRKTGELVERKPHIHIVIPEKNLLTGQNLNPFGKVDQQTKFLEAFQEHANAKYGLASPKDNRRLEFTGESELISRYKGDYFHGNNAGVKERILSDVLDRQISDYDSFKSSLSEHGATRTRNAGKDNEYQNVKPADQAKGINLKEYVFSREFIEKPAEEKRLYLAEESRKQYDSQQAPRMTAPDLADRLKEWHEVRAPELKYINSGNRKLYANYRDAERDDKKAILADRATAFYQKHRQEHNHDRSEPGGDFRARENNRIDNRRLVADIANNLRAAGRNIESTRGAFGSHEQARRNLADRRTSRALAALSQRLGSHQTENKHLTPSTPQPRDIRSADNVPGQLAAEQRESSNEAKAATLSEFTQIKRELDASRLLAHLSKTHGVIPEKYQVTKGRDSGDRIKAGSRNLNVSDFLTQEMRLSFSEAAPILRRVYAAQLGREAAEARTAPRRDLWEEFKRAQPDPAKQKAEEWDAQRQSERERRAAIRSAYQAQRKAIKSDKHKSPAERKAELSIVSMEKVSKDIAFRETVAAERKQLKEGQRYQARYRAFLLEKANNGDEAALAELRRQQDVNPLPTGPNTIEGLTKKRDDERAAQLARNLAYSIDRAGNVTYYADQTKRRALVVDSGQQITVAAVKNKQAVETGLLLAVQKFGPNVKISGNDEFKKQVIEAALKSGIHVEFDNKAMNDELNRRRAERDELLSRGKAFIAAERDKSVSTQTQEPTSKDQQEPAVKPPRKSRDHDIER